jgi:hypothetical protein
MTFGRSVESDDAEAELRGLFIRRALPQPVAQTFKKIFRRYMNQTGRKQIAVNVTE